MDKSFCIAKVLLEKIVRTNRAWSTLGAEGKMCVTSVNA